MKYLPVYQPHTVRLSLPSWECGLKYVKRANSNRCHFVTPFVGVWIEIFACLPLPLLRHVTPFVGVWIEIHKRRTGSSRASVTPFVGVWIEMFIVDFLLREGYVTPFVGVWIEIWPAIRIFRHISSLPSWECGLKSVRKKEQPQLEQIILPEEK